MQRKLILDYYTLMKITRLPKHFLKDRFEDNQLILHFHTKFKASTEQHKGSSILL